MALDYMLVRAACAQWMHAEMRFLPRSPVEPVVWIDAKGKMRMYHPAMPLEDMQVRRTEWDKDSFKKVVMQFVQPAAQVIADEMASEQMPPSFYADYPNIVKQYTLGDGDDPTDVIEVGG